VGKATRPSADPPLAARLLGGIEGFQLDHSCALLLLAGAGLALLGGVAAWVVGAVRDVEVTVAVLTLFGFAVAAALVGAWMLRRIRRPGAAPLGLRIFAALCLLLPVPHAARRMVQAWQRGDRGVILDLLMVVYWVGVAVWLWRAGSAAHPPVAPTEARQPSP